MLLILFDILGEKKEALREVALADIMTILHDDIQRGKDILNLKGILSLHKRLTILQSKRIVSVSEWAKSKGLNVRSALNMAKKQTIPSFRLRGKWMIDFASDAFR